MGRRYAVKTLEEIAFAASYHEILSNLLLCPDHRPEDKRNLNSYSSLIATNSLLTSQNVLSFVRGRLNQHLIGTMNDEIRKKFVEKFFHCFYECDNKTDVWVFLDCVLDENITELQNVYVAFPSSEPNVKLIKTIAKHSPLLKTLKLNFDLIKRKTSLDVLKPITLSLFTLNHLTSLTLCHLKKRHRSILSTLGKSCPRLNHLGLSGFRILKKDIVVLILGELTELLPSKDKHKICIDDDSEIHGMQVSSEYLSPFCSTLQHLQLEDVDERKKLQASCEYSGLSHSAVAFAFRHLPRLQRIDHSGSSVSSAVKILHKISFDRDTSESHPEKQKVYEDSSDPQSASPRLILEWNIDSPFSGCLSLTSLEFVNIRSVEMLKAVGSMCPNLKDVVFCDLLHADPISSEELKFVLETEWPKVERVTLIKVSPEYCKAVLKAIGGQIRQLTFVSCQSISIMDLVSCVQLESLRILFSSSLIVQEGNQLETTLTAENFLPKLKSMESDICLSSKSRLFEENPGLTHLVLDCCHIGTKMSPLEWSSIIKLWPRIQTLRIRRSTGLTMTMVGVLFPQLSKLKELSLSSMMMSTKSERQLSYNLTDRLANESSNICLKFERSTSNIGCPYQDSSDVYETSDEDSSSCDSEDSSPYLLARAVRNHGRSDDVEFDDDWADNLDAFDIDEDDDLSDDYDESDYDYDDDGEW